MLLCTPLTRFIIITYLVHTKFILSIIVMHTRRIYIYNSTIFLNGRLSPSLATMRIIMPRRTYILPSGSNAIVVLFKSHDVLVMHVYVCFCSRYKTYICMYLFICPRRRYWLITSRPTRMLSWFLWPLTNAMTSRVVDQLLPECIRVQSRLRQERVFILQVTANRFTGDRDFVT